MLRDATMMMMMLKGQQGTQFYCHSPLQISLIYEAQLISTKLFEYFEAVVVFSYSKLCHQQTNHLLTDSPFALDKCLLLQ